jgi:diguanylate cyclase (GGDEF)-like protein
MGGRGPLLIEDTKNDPVSSSMPLTEKANIGSYLGVPLFYQSGEVFGTLCALDSKPSKYNPETLKALENLSQLFTYVLDLEDKATRDQLTGLYNRHFLYQLFDEKISLDAAAKGTLMFLDLDGFKEVNDKYGHELGDIVLKEVAHRIQKCLPENGFGVRLGGDEFVLLLPQISDKNEIEQKAREILDIMSSWHIYEQHLSLSTSIGITLYPDDDKKIRTLLKYADTAMYQAKEHGKNTYRFF